MQITKLNKVREMSRHERGLLLQSVLLLPLIHLALMLFGFSRVQRWMQRLRPLKQKDRSHSGVEIVPRAREISRIVSVAADHGLYRATCLRRSMLVWWFLRRDGMDSQICFGVRTIGGRLLAHAWVEWDGIVLNDSIDITNQYRALQAGLPATTLGL